MRPILQFGLGTLLFLTLCVAGYFGGYRAGYDDGAADYTGKHVSTQQYGIADLVDVHPKQEDVDFVVRSIEETIGRGAWSKFGGFSTIRFNPETLALDITTTEAIHRETNGFLTALRMGRSLDNPYRAYSFYSPERAAKLNVEGICARPGLGQPGVDERSFIDAMKSAFPQATVHVVHDDKLLVTANLIETHYMNVTLDAIRKLKYVDRFEIHESPDGASFVHDWKTRQVWRQQPAGEPWILVRQD
jgi:hypothetical protein